jgi:hypothetical protein
MNDFELFFLQYAKNKRKVFCPQTTQINADAEKNSSSACLCEVCGQVWIRLRLAALGLLVSGCSVIVERSLVAPKPPWRRRRKTRKNRKNRKIDFCPFFNWNLLLLNPFQQKQAVGILRLLRKNCAWVYGGEGVNESS